MKDKMRDRERIMYLESRVKLLEEQIAAITKIPNLRDSSRRGKVVAKMTMFANGKFTYLIALPNWFSAGDRCIQDGTNLTIVLMERRRDIVVTDHGDHYFFCVSQRDYGLPVNAYPFTITYPVFPKSI